MWKQQHHDDLMLQLHSEDRAALCLSDPQLHAQQFTFN